VALEEGDRERAGEIRTRKVFELHTREKEGEKKEWKGSETSCQRKQLKLGRRERRWVATTKKSKKKGVKKVRRRRGCSGWGSKREITPAV